MSNPITIEDDDVKETYTFEAVCLNCGQEMDLFCLIGIPATQTDLFAIKCECCDCTRVLAKKITLRLQQPDDESDTGFLPGLMLGSMFR